MLPGVATVYCAMFAVDELMRKEKIYQAEMKSGNISKLPEVGLLVLCG